MTARIRELEAALAQKTDGQLRLSLDDSSPGSQSSMEKTSSDSPPEPESDEFIDAFGNSNEHSAMLHGDAFIRDAYNRRPRRN